MERVRDRLLEFMEWLRYELTKLFQIGRLKYDATSLQRERTALFQELGMKAAELVKRGEVTSEELKLIVERVDTLTARIEERRTEMEKLVRTRTDDEPPVAQK
ncbi:MAG: hypothetical protein V1495_04050 [Pseudomonadota bacterium]